MLFPITEHVAKRNGHTTFYLACGAMNAPLIIFVHGWPELSISWRHQLPAFAALGFRAIAPDMRGYGRSTVYARHEDYAVQHAVSDMLGLLQSLARDQALWVGHDWGSPVVWALASYYPERCVGVANLCVPYLPDGFAPQTLVPLVDRAIYPKEAIPRRSVGLPTLLRGEFRPSWLLFRGRRRGDCAGLVSSRRSSKRRQTLSNSLCPKIRRLFWRSWPRT